MRFRPENNFKVATNHTETYEHGYNGFSSQNSPNRHRDEYVKVDDMLNNPRYIHRGGSSMENSNSRDGQNLLSHNNSHKVRGSSRLSAANEILFGLNRPSHHRTGSQDNSPLFKDMENFHSENSSDNKQFDSNFKLNSYINQQELLVSLNAKTSTIKV